MKTTEAMRENEEENWEEMEGDTKWKGENQQAGGICRNRGEAKKKEDKWRDTGKKRERGADSESGNWRIQTVGV